MLEKSDREMLQKTAEHAMQFVFDHITEDDVLCQLVQVLVGMMHNICQRERQELGLATGVCLESANLESHNMNAGTQTRITGIGVR